MLKHCLREKEIWEVDCVLFEIVQVKVFSLRLSAGFSFDGKGTIFFSPHRIQLIKDTPSAKEGGVLTYKKKGGVHHQKFHSGSIYSKCTF